MSDSNRVSISMVSESVIGTLPTNPAWNGIRFTGAPDLVNSPKTVTSEEIRSDRQVADLLLVGKEAGGSFDFEFSPGVVDFVLGGVFFSNWVNKVERTGGDLTDITLTTNINVTDLVLDFVPGMFCRTTGFTNAANNKNFVALTGTVATLVKSSGLVNETPPATAKVQQIGFQGAAGDIAAATGPNSLTATLLDFTTMGLSVGEWVKIGGLATGERFATAASNGWARISAIAAGVLTFDAVPTGFAIDAGTGKTLTVFAGDYLRNGVIKQGFSLERAFNDHSPITYEVFKGMVPNTFSMKLAAAAVVTANIGLLGFDSVVSNTRTAGSTDIAAPTNTQFTASANVGRLGENGVPVVGPNFVIDAGIDINNNLRRQVAVGSLGAVGVGVGEFGVTGSLNTFFGNKTLLEKVLNNTESSYDTVLEVGNKGFLLDLPRIKFSDGAPSVPGKNQDILINLAFQAIRHTTLGYTAQAQRFAFVE